MSQTQISSNRGSNIGEVCVVVTTTFLVYNYLRKYSIFKEDSYQCGIIAFMATYLSPYSSVGILTIHALEGVHIIFEKIKEKLF